MGTWSPSRMHSLPPSRRTFQRGALATGIDARHDAVALRWRSTNTSRTTLKPLQAGKRTSQTGPDAKHYLANLTALPAQTCGAPEPRDDDFTISSTLRCLTPVHASLSNLPMSLCPPTPLESTNLTALPQVFVTSRESRSSSWVSRAGRSTSCSRFG